jgi:predicted outer membrane repeat protein
LYFVSNSKGLLKNCSLLGSVSPTNTDIARYDTTATVTFACADGEVGTPVQMSGTEITKIPAPTCAIASWTLLSSSITAAAGKAVTLTLSTPFDNGDPLWTNQIEITTAHTSITIVGNGAVFDAGGKYYFFRVYQAVELVMSNVTLQNGNSGDYANGGAIFVTGTATFTYCIFSGNTADPSYGPGGAGAIYVEGTATLIECIFFENTGPLSPYIGGGAMWVSSGTATLIDCTFSRNTATGAGGALFFWSNTTGLLKNCSLLGSVSLANNDIARRDTTANVTFACADGEVGTPVQMSGTEITKIPAPTCTAGKYICRNGGKANWQCVEDSSGISWPDCQEVCSP